MNKEKFCEILERVERANKFAESVDNLCWNYSHDNKTDVNMFGLGLGLDTDVVNLLAEIMQDEGEDISYFCWEIDFGREYKPGIIKDKDGNDIDFSDAEHLYDYLERNRQ